MVRCDTVNFALSAERHAYMMPRMTQDFLDFSQFLTHGFDDVIDVRSPAEFAEDHVPGAINLPVLDNAERARVGTIYVQESRFLARRIGAALVFQNAARHIEGPLADRERDWRPLVYCWRGGQRSGAFGWMLRQIGWQAETVEGGYRSYRRAVNRMLHLAPLPFKAVLLGGYTGTAKTDLLHRLSARGVQVLDLEGLARHRGSLLGEMDAPQPSQKGFETAIAQVLARLDPARPVVIEAESSKVGECLVPPSLWAVMRAAPWIEVSAPIKARAVYLDHAYDDILSDTDRLRERLAPLRSFRGREVVDRWFAMIDANDRLALTQALMEQHYDPAYAKSRKGVDPRTLGEVAMNALDDAALDAAAARIEAIVASWDMKDSPAG
ncbi:tRNA 2-selenouridine synthase [Primorskyibacter flagellatus]|uniref:tRNA 2-selenouridine synthase n=2 Tax=Primorskyibacter flagellatus TaxID=1387277 RepID=A0A1W2EA55_9RHOB|nr:tRNA 2-selenouridine synthase [Primorskyibacter flagellatus]